MKKVGITGAAGYIGSRVTKLLIEEGHEVVPIDNFYNSQVKEIKGEKVLEGDIRNREEIEEKFSDVDIIMHLAAISGVDDCNENRDLAFEVNVKGTSNIAYICRKHEIPLIFPMSMAVIGDPQEFPITAEHPRDPLNWYGRTKAINEETIRKMAEGSFPAHIYMKSNLYGSHKIGDTEISKGTVINYFISCAEKEDPLTVYEPGSQARDFIHVKDIAKAYLQSMEVLLEGEETGATTLPLASGNSTSVMEVAKKVQEAFKQKKDYEPEIKLVENPRDNEALSDNFKIDISRSKELLKFKTDISIRSSLKEEPEGIL